MDAPVGRASTDTVHETIVPSEEVWTMPRPRYGASSG
jgi:hypothetical protein